MQLIKIIQARAALCRLTETRFKNFAVSRSLCALRKRVDEEVQFLQTEQQKAINAYAELKDGKPAFTDGGNVLLKSPADKETFEAEIKRLLELEISNISAVVIAEADFRSHEDYPSPDDMMALDGLVEFTEG